MLVTGCGTTVDAEGRLRSGVSNGTPGALDPAQSAGSAGDQQSSPGATPAVADAVPGISREAGAPDGVEPPQGSAGGSLRPASTIPATGRGWDKQFVYIGMSMAKDAGTGLAALGIKLNPGDQEADAYAVVDHLNAQGGLFGRKVKLLVHDNSSAQLQANLEAAASENCAYFTQDRPVIAVINMIAVMETDNFRSCLSRAHTPLISTGAQYDDTTTGTLAPYFYSAVVISYTKLIPSLVERLQKQGWLTPWDTARGAPSRTSRVKVGILYGSDDASGRDGPALAREFARRGVATDSFQYSDYGQASAAVLKFAGGGVTHVISLDAFLLLFATAANSQRYFPRFGVTTYNAPQSLLEGNVQSSQLAGAMGIGFKPGMDVDFRQDPGNVGAAKRECLKALADGGQRFSGQRFAEAVGLGICDSLRLMVLGAKAGKGLDPKAVRGGILALGLAFPVSDTFGSGLTATSFSVPGAGRDLRYDSACSCFRYQGSTYRIV